MRTAVVAGVGMYAPERVVGNDYFNDLYKRDMDTYLREKRNVRERRFMDPSQATSDLAVPAAREAMLSARIEPADLDLIILATDTPDYVSPSTASVVQHKLGARNAGTFDLNSACAGFVTALDLAGKYILADARYRSILVVGAYGMSKHLDWGDYKVASIFADGAGAVVVQAGSGSQGFLASQLYSDGQYHDSMGIYAGGTYLPVSEAVLARGEHRLKFRKRIPPETNGRMWPELTRCLLDRIGRKPSEIDHFFMTQLNIASIHEALDRLEVPRARSHSIMDRFGYTGSACIPMALADAARLGRMKKGDLVFLLGSGGGMSMAALAMTWAIE